MNWSYIAGFFDGEGYLSLKTKYKGIGYWNLGITQKKPEALWLMCEFIGMGCVRKRTNHPCSDYFVYKQQDIKYVLEKLLPYLIVRYDKALEVIQYIRKHKTGLRRPR